MSGHHGTTHSQFENWRRRPGDMENSCEYTELRGSASAWGLGKELVTPYHKKSSLRNVTKGLGFGSEPSRTW